MREDGGTWLLWLINDTPFGFSIGSKRGYEEQLVSWCFEPSQLHRNMKNIRSYLVATVMTHLADSV